MSKYFARFSHYISNAVGKPISFVLALLVVCSWAVAGPIFGYSEVWQLVINTGTTIVTFLMIFVLQNSQNRDGQALQAKLDELILASKNAENRFIGIEKLDDSELIELRKLIDEKCNGDGDCKEEIAEEMAGTGLEVARTH